MAVVISDRLLDGGTRLLDAEPDDHLVSLARSGHEAAFAAIVRRYGPELHATARRLTSDGRGEDAVQQAFLNAFAALQAGAEVRHLRGWLHQILRNAATRARAPMDAPLESAAVHGESLEETVLRRAQAHATLLEISALPERQRDAFVSNAVLGFPRAYVARTMGLSEGAVRQLVHRARRRVRQAAGALLPLPLTRLLGGVDAAPDAAIGAGTAASGGLAIKVGALVASGVAAAGIAVTHAFPARHHASLRASTHQRHATRGHAIRETALAPAVAAAPPSALAVTHHVPSGAQLPASTGHPRGSTGRAGRLSAARSGRHGGSDHGAGRGDRHGHGSGAAGGDGNSGSGHSGSGDAGRSGASSSGAGHDGSGSSDHGGGSGAASGSGSATGSGHLGSGSSDGGSASPGGGSGPVWAARGLWERRIVRWQRRRCGELGRRHDQCSLRVVGIGFGFGD